MTANPRHSSKSNEHYTPAYIVEAARKTLGEIDLDPASSERANSVVKASRFFSSGGLEQPWHGRVFLNPPGGKAPDGSPTRSNAVLWWAKLMHEFEVGRCDSAIFVGFSIEILQSCQALSMRQPASFPFCIPAKRIPFLHPDTLEPQEQPGHANVIIFVHGRFNEGLGQIFDDYFSPIGKCVNT